MTEKTWTFDVAGPFRGSEYRMRCLELAVRAKDSGLCPDEESITKLAEKMVAFVEGSA